LSSLGSVLTGSSLTVTASSKLGTNLVVSAFQPPPRAACENNIAQWNGTQWSALGNSFTAAITTMTRMTATFIREHFTTASGVTVTNIGSVGKANNWSSLGALTYAYPGTAGTEMGLHAVPSSKRETARRRIFSAGRRAGSGRISRMGRHQLELLGRRLTLACHKSSPHSRRSDALYAAALFYTAGRAVANQVAASTATNGRLGGGIVGKMTLVRVRRGRPSRSRFLHRWTFPTPGYRRHTCQIERNILVVRRQRQQFRFGPGPRTAPVLKCGRPHKKPPFLFYQHWRRVPHRRAQWNGPHCGAGVGTEYPRHLSCWGADGLYAGGSFNPASGTTNVISSPTGRARIGFRWHGTPMG